MAGCTPATPVLLVALRNRRLVRTFGRLRALQPVVRMQSGDLLTTLAEFEGVTEGGPEDVPREGHGCRDEQDCGDHEREDEEAFRKAAPRDGAAELLPAPLTRVHDRAHQSETDERERSDQEGGGDVVPPQAHHRDGDQADTETTASDGRRDDNDVIKHGG